MNWQLWLEGLAAAAIGGAVTQITTLGSTTGSLNHGSGTAAIIGAIAGIGLYLRTPPKQQ